MMIGFVVAAPDPLIPVMGTVHANVSLSMVVLLMDELTAVRVLEKF